jgi:hypothetical protein
MNRKPRIRAQLERNARICRRENGGPMENIPDPKEFYGRCSCTCGCVAEFGPSSAPIGKDDVCDDCFMDCRKAGPNTLARRAYNQR